MTGPEESIATTAIENGLLRARPQLHAAGEKEKGVIGARNPKVSTRNPFTPFGIDLAVFKVYSLGAKRLKEALNERGMNQVDFARRIGISRKHLKEILDGALPIVPETALELERVLGIPARFWNNGEQQYRDFVARKAEAGRLEKRRPGTSDTKASGN